MQRSFPCYPRSFTILIVTLLFTSINAMQSRSYSECRAILLSPKQLHSWFLCSYWHSWHRPNRLSSRFTSLHLSSDFVRFRCFSLHSIIPTWRRWSVCGWIVPIDTDDVFLWSAMLFGSMSLSSMVGDGWTAMCQAMFLTWIMRDHYDSLDIEQIFVHLFCFVVLSLSSMSFVSSNSTRFPSCSIDLRQAFRPLQTRDELERLKRYSSSQKHLAQHLIKTQRLITSAFLRRTTRYHPEMFGLKPVRSDPRRSKILAQRNSSTASIFAPDERKPISLPILTFQSCSQLIAEGHGIVQLKHSSSQVNRTLSERSQQWNESIFNEEISLSNSRPKRFNRTAFLRRNASKLSTTYSFTTLTRDQFV